MDKQKLINNINLPFSNKKAGLIESTGQLSNNIKIKEGYNQYDFVIDVGQREYAISYGECFLFTCGIDTCCGVVVYDKEKMILFHLDGTSSFEDVKRINDLFKFHSNSSVLIFPGAMSSMPGTFNYNILEKNYSDMGYNVAIHKISNTFGYIKVFENQIKFGSLLLKENEQSIDINRNRFKNL